MCRECRKELRPRAACAFGVTPRYEYATTAADRGINVIIAGAGGAAHLPGMVAALTPLPVCLGERQGEPSRVMQADTT